MHEAWFRAMGCDAHVAVHGGSAELLTAARRRVDDLEARWSRFRPTSEVSELNRRAGSAVAVSAETVELVERSIDGWRMSGASVDPTVLGDVLRAGYVCSFEQLGAEASAGSSFLTTGCDDIEIIGGLVRLPAGTGFDPGGIGKGLAADFVATEVMAGGADGVCVNLGGDLRVDGCAADGVAWTVAVEDPWTGAPIVRLGVRRGAVATSSTLRRHWVADGQPRHHLIDPATGQPSMSDLVAVTVVAGEGWMADVLAKAVLLRGSAHPFDLIGGSGAEAVAVDRNGVVQATDGIAAFLGDQSLPAFLEPQEPGTGPAFPESEALPC
jgi:thiamine biosynthesis lipoprotein